VGENLPEMSISGTETGMKSMEENRKDGIEGVLGDEARELEDEEISGQEDVMMNGRVLDNWEKGPQYVLKLYNLTEFLDKHTMGDHILHGKFDDVLLMKMVGYNQRKLGNLMSEWGQAAMKKRNQAHLGDAHMIDRFRVDGDFKIRLMKAKGGEGQTQIVPLTVNNVRIHGREPLTRAIKGLIFRMKVAKYTKVEYLAHSVEIGDREETSFRKMAIQVENVGKSITKTVSAKVESLITEFERSTKRLKTFHATCLESVTAETNQLLSTLESNKALIQSALEEHDVVIESGISIGGGNGRHSGGQLGSHSCGDRGIGDRCVGSHSGSDRDSSNEHDSDADDARSVFDDDPIVWVLPNGDVVDYDVKVVDEALAAMKEIKHQCRMTAYQTRDRSFYNGHNDMMFTKSFLQMKTLPQFAWEEWRHLADFLISGRPA